MDLGFTPPSPADAAPLSPADTALLTAALAAAGARDMDGCPAPAEPLAPAGGAFSAAMAARLTQWRRA